MMSLRWLIGSLVGGLAMVYPFLVYYGLNQYGPSVFASLLFILLVIRVVIKGSYHEPSQWLQLLVVGLFCLTVMFLDSELLLRYYPVLMSFGFSALFAYSLKSKTSLVERFAKMAGQDYPEEAIGYMCGLTKVWAVLLFINALISAYTACCLSLKYWTLYNGLLAYFLLGGFALIELIFRHFYKRKFAKE